MADQAITGAFPWLVLPPGMEDAWRYMGSPPVPPGVFPPGWEGSGGGNPTPEDPGAGGMQGAPDATAAPPAAPQQYTVPGSAPRDLSPVPDTGEGTWWKNAAGAAGDIGTAAAGLAERFNKGALNTLGLRSPGSDIYRADIPVAPGLERAGDVATFLTGGLSNSLFPAPGALSAAAGYAPTAVRSLGRTVGELAADEAGAVPLRGRLARGTPIEMPPSTEEAAAARDPLAGVPVRPATEDVGDVMDASFVHSRDVGPSTMKMEDLSGGVSLNDPAARKRVDALKANITGDGGYISRPIVDTEGNVLEGQHRVEALRELGAQNVPVHVVEDLAANVDLNNLNSAVDSAQKMRSDTRNQVVNRVLDAVKDAGSPAAVRDIYEPLRGYEAAWDAALDAIEKGGKPTPVPEGVQAPGVAAKAPTPPGALPPEGAPAAAAEAPVPVGIRTYHGSPHDFPTEPGYPLGRFRDDKIGTGEGAQAIAYGHYSAEAEPVAQSYRDQISLGQVRAPGVEANLSEHPELGKAARHLYNANGDFNLAAERIRQFVPDTEQTLASLQQLKQMGAAPYSGKMYEVNLKAEPHQFLDWDKPLSEQSAKIQGLVPVADDGRAILPNGERVDPAKLRGEGLYRALAEGLGGSHPAASQKLRDAGIPGVRYLDQGSRAVGQGSHNYVVFDPATMEILRKYGLAGLIAGGGALGLGGAAQARPLPGETGR